MPRRRSTSRRRLGPAVAAAIGAMAAGVVLPEAFRVDHRFPFVDSVAWRPHAAASTLAAAAVLANGRRTRPAAALLGVVGLAGICAVARRAVAGAVPSPPPGPGDVTILAFNVLRGCADTGELATVLERETPDFVVLPEAGPDFRDKLLPLVELLGYRSWVSTDPGSHDSNGVTLLVAERVGDVRVRTVSAMRLRHLEATGGVLGRRTLYAAHTTAPTRPRWVRQWREDLKVVRRWCEAPMAPIVVGDLNATLDHGLLRAALGGCRSAADGTGRGLVGTYPSSLPRWFGIQIDHVLVPAGTPTTRFEILDIEGSDHRGVLATVCLAEAA